MEKDKLICTCMEVYESEITRAIKDKKLLTSEEVGDVTGAGTVCGENGIIPASSMLAAGT